MMGNQSVGGMIGGLRKEKGMTQKNLADKLNVTDKAVSKWERDIACPDIHSIPRLAEVLDVSIDDLLHASSKKDSNNENVDKIINTILKAIPLAMGIAVVVTSLLKGLDACSGFTMLGIGVSSIGLYLLKNKE